MDFINICLSYFHTTAQENVFKEFFQQRFSLFKGTSLKFFFFFWHYMVYIKYICHDNKNPKQLYTEFQIQVHKNIWNTIPLVLQASYEIIITFVFLIQESTVSMGDTVQDSQWMPKTSESTKSHAYYVFSYTDLHFHLKEVL